MLRIAVVICIFSLAFSFDSYAQGNEVFITVKGKALNKEDSTELQGVTVFYEKLPYYDDMGMSKTSTTGDFSFHLAKNTTYSFRIEGIPGYQAYNEEIIIEDEDGNQETTISLRVAPEEKEELITLDNLTFGRGSATIQTSSYQSLNDFIEYINQRKDVLIQLEGHTDFAGNAEANMRLSQARVDAVAEYLSKNGVKKTRITTRAFGGTNPLTQDRTDDAKRRNRRVEVRLIRQ